MKKKMKIMLLAMAMIFAIAGAVNAEYTVDAGADMVTWHGQPVILDPIVVDTLDPNNPSPDVTYSWSTGTMPAGVTVTFDPSTEVASPSVTIVGPAVPEFAQVDVPNPGFETRMDPIYEGTNAWTTDGQARYTQGHIDLWRHYDYYGNGGPVRIWNPTAADFNGDPDAPEGELVARVYTRQNDPDYPLISREWEAAVQLLDEPFNPAIDYKMTVLVGNPIGMLYNGYAVQLVAGGENVDGAAYAKAVVGGTVIAEDYNTLTVPEGDFVESTVLYTANSASADLAGLPLQIRLIAFEDPLDHSTTSFVAFDDIKLYARRIKLDLTLSVDDAVTPTGTPVTDSMTIDVYDDACKALFFNDRASLDVTDFDEDCKTDLSDFAVLASSWLDDYALTAPQDK